MEQRNNENVIKLLVENGALLRRELNRPQDDTEKLYKAILARNEKEGLDAIKGEINYVQRFDDKNLLYLAVENDLSQIVKALIEGISRISKPINFFDTKAETLLTKAIKNGNYTIAGLLILQEGYDVNKVDSYKHTPLHLAAQRGQVDIVEQLLEIGAVNSKNREGLTPKDSAQKQISKTKYPAEQEKYQRIAELLNSKFGDTGSGAGEILSPKIKDMILSEDLVAAIKEKDMPADTVIEKIGEVFKEALAYKQKSPGKNTILHWSAKYGRDEVVKYLVEKYGLDKDWINQKNNSGFTPLHFAAESGNEEIVNLLLQAGAKPKVEDQRKRTPKDVAAIKEHTEIIKLLSEHEKGSRLNLIIPDNTDLQTGDEQYIRDTESMDLDIGGNQDENLVARALLDMKTSLGISRKRSRSEGDTNDEVCSKRSKDDQGLNLSSLKLNDGSASSGNITNLFNNLESRSQGSGNDDLTLVIDDANDSTSQTMETEPLGKTTSFGSMCIIS